jgi:hypothetical protein
MGLYNTIKGLARTAASVPDAEPGDEEAMRAAVAHKRIAVTACCGAALGLALGLTVAGWALFNGAGVASTLVLTVPPAFGVAGFAFGVALACMVAPRSFLEGPAGRPWMRLIGTRSVALARVVCLLLAVGAAALAAFILGVVIFTSTQARRPPRPEAAASRPNASAQAGFFRGWFMPTRSRRTSSSGSVGLATRTSKPAWRARSRSAAVAQAV